MLQAVIHEMSGKCLRHLGNTREISWIHWRNYREIVRRSPEMSQERASPGNVPEHLRNRPGNSLETSRKFPRD